MKNRRPEENLILKNCPIRADNGATFDFRLSTFVWLQNFLWQQQKGAEFFCLVRFILYLS